MVLEASEGLAGKYGANHNEKSNFGYTEKEWEWIWSSMMEDGAWAVPGVTDSSGVVVKENFAPEILIFFTSDLYLLRINLYIRLFKISFSSGTCSLYLVSRRMLT